MNRVPITSPLAVLTTQTTQEHIVATHSTTDLKPGDTVRHPKKGPGIVRRNPVTHQTYIAYNVDDTDYEPLTGWERVETCTERERTILDSYQRASTYGYTYVDTRDNVVMAPRKATEGSTGQRAESTPPTDEKPMSATVTLYCPDCGEAENVTVVMLGRQSNGERWFDLREFHAHTCPPAQPDEPTEFGARVTVTLPDGTREKWCRLGKHHSAPWLGETYDVPGEEWSLLIKRGTVTLGWDDGEQP